MRCRVVVGATVGASRSCCISLVTLLTKAARRGAPRTDVTQLSLFGSRPAPGEAPALGGPTHTVHVKQHTRVTPHGVQVVRAHDARIVIPRDMEDNLQVEGGRELAPEAVRDRLRDLDADHPAHRAALRDHVRVLRAVRQATQGMADHTFGDEMQIRLMGRAPWSEQDPTGAHSKDAWRQLADERLSARGLTATTDETTFRALQSTAPQVALVDHRQPLFEQLVAMREQAEAALAERQVPRLRAEELLEQLPTAEEVEGYRRGARTADDVADLVRDASEALRTIEALPPREPDTVSDPEAFSSAGLVAHHQHSERADGVYKGEVHVHGPDGVTHKVKLQLEDKHRLQGADHLRRAGLLEVQREHYPWTMTGDQYAHSLGLSRPMLAEISGLQRSRMSKRALRQYDASQDARRNAHYNAQDEWADKVREAYLEGRIDANDPGITRGGFAITGANDVIRGHLARRRKEIEDEEKIAQAEENAAQEWKPGDMGHSIWRRRKGTVVKVLKQHVWMKYDDEDAPRKEFGHPQRQSPEEFEAAVAERVRRRVTQEEADRLERRRQHLAELTKATQLSLFSGPTHPVQVKEHTRLTPHGVEVVHAHTERRAEAAAQPAVPARAASAPVITQTRGPAPAPPSPGPLQPSQADLDSHARKVGAYATQAVHVNRAVAGDTLSDDVDANITRWTAEPDRTGRLHWQMYLHHRFERPDRSVASEWRAVSSSALNPREMGKLVERAHGAGQGFRWGRDPSKVAPVHADWMPVATNELGPTEYRRGHYRIRAARGRAELRDSYTVSYHPRGFDRNSEFSASRDSLELAQQAVAEHEARLANPHHDPMTDKSLGHVAFVGDDELYHNEDGALMRASRRLPRDVWGYRPGRFEVAPRPDGHRALIRDRFGIDLATPAPAPAPAVDPAPAPTPTLTLTLTPIPTPTPTPTPTPSKAEKDAKRQFLAIMEAHHGLRRLTDPEHMHRDAAIFARAFDDRADFSLRPQMRAIEADLVDGKPGAEKRAMEWLGYASDALSFMAERARRTQQSDTMPGQPTELSYDRKRIVALPLKHEDAPDWVNTGFHRAMQGYPIMRGLQGEQLAAHKLGVLEAKRHQTRRKLIETAEKWLTRSRSPVAKGDVGDLEKATQMQMNTRPGLALLPSSHNPNVRRWQMVTHEHAQQQGVPLLRDLATQAQALAAKLPADAHLGGGSAADLGAVAGRVLAWVPAMERTGRVPERQAAADADQLHALMEVAPRWRPPPSVQDRTPAQLARMVAIGVRMREPRAGRDPWGVATVAAAEALARIPGHDHLRDVVDTRARVAALPTDAWLPSVRLTAGRLNEVLRHQLGPIASGQASSIDLHAVQSDLATWQAPPTTAQMVLASDDDLRAMHERAQVLGGAGPWARARVTIEAEMERRQRPPTHPVVQARQALSKLTDHELLSAADSYTRRKSRGQIDSDLEMALAEERAFRALARTGHAA